MDNKYSTNRFVRRDEEQRSRIRDPENLPRVVLIVCDAAIAQAALDHNGVQACVAVRETAAAVRLAKEGAGCSIATMLVLDFAVTTTAHEENGGAGGAGGHGHTHHDAGGNACRVCALAGG